MSCMVSRLLTDLTRSADRRIAATGPEHWDPAARAADSRLVYLHCPPGLTQLSLAHARASARYFALSYAYASGTRICTAVGLLGHPGLLICLLQVIIAARYDGGPARLILVTPQYPVTPMSCTASSPG